MYPRILHIHGPLWINSYGLMIALGFLTFITLLYYNPIRKKVISSNDLFNLTFIGIISGIIGGRVFFLFTNFEDFYGNWLDIFLPWVGGFSILGTIIAVLVTISFYLKKHNIKIFPVIDIATLYAPLFQSISRIGCFLAGCCHGIPASKNIPWATMFTNPHSLAPLYIYLHPTQLYLSISSFCIFVLLYIFYKTHYKTLGQISFMYLFFESISRFSIDFLRGDRDFITPHFFLSYSQVTAIALFIIAIIGFIYVTNKQTKIIK